MTDAPRTLGELALEVRSKNAGPFWMTLEAFMPDEETYRIADSLITTELISSSWTERGTRCSTPGPEGPPGPVTHPAAGLTRRPECSDDERLAGGLGRTAYAAAHSRTDVFHDHEDFCII